MPELRIIDGTPTEEPKVVELGAHSNMSVVECLELNNRRAAEFTEVIVIAFHQDGSFIVNASHIKLPLANWMIDHAKQHVMDYKEPDRSKDFLLGA